MKLSTYSEHQLRTSLRSLTGSALALSEHHTISEVFMALQDQGNLRLPCEPETLFVVAERFPILADILKPRGSLLVAQLMDRPEEVAVVVDSVKSGKDAIYLSRLFVDPASISEWVCCMHPQSLDFVVKTVDESYSMILAKLKSFIVPGDEA